MTASLVTRPRIFHALLLVCAAAAQTLSPSAQAANVSVSNVSDLNGLFGSINFYPETNQFVLVPNALAAPAIPGQTDFAAIAVGGATSPFAISFGTLTATFTADPGFKIDSISLIEVGKFARAGSSARTFVGGSVTVNGAAPINFIPSPDSTNGDQDAALSDWSIGGAGSEVNMLVNGSVASLVLSNVLGASIDSSSSDIAVIFKTAVVMTINTSPVVVPVPAAVWMLGSGLLALGVQRRRKLNA